MTEVPAIVQYGNQWVFYYDEAEFRDALKLAFGRHRADFVVLDDHRTGQRFRAACVAWCIQQNLLYCSETIQDQQSEVSTFRLTDRGRQMLEETEKAT